METPKHRGVVSDIDDRLGAETTGVGDGARSTVRPLLSPPGLHGGIIREERTWRLPDIPGGNERHRRLFAARWRGADLHEQTAEITDDYHMLSITLRPSRFSFRLGAAWHPNTQVVPGVVQLTRPAQEARIVYYEPYDALHLYLHETFLKEYVECCRGVLPSGEIVLRDPCFTHDPVLERLGTALLSAGDIGQPHGELYVDSLGLAIVARLFAHYGAPAPTSQRPVGALPAWRLKRVTEFIEAHSGEPITLVDLAESVGLSRMHFAAQFRKATGLRPHEYLLRQRIAKAKAMLANSSLPIVDVALAVGFGSQAHFTGVFKRFTGRTPLRWREDSR